MTGNNAVSGVHGICPVCARWMLVKKDGTIRHHGGPDCSATGGFGRAYCCNGAGQPPYTGRVFTADTPPPHGEKIRMISRKGFHLTWDGVEYAWEKFPDIRQFWPPNQEPGSEWREVPWGS